MANTQPLLINQNGYSLNREFHQFMESAVIPATKLSSVEFWTLFTSSLDTATANAKTECTSCSSNDIQKAEFEVSLGDATLTMNTIHSRWGSFYDELYSNGTTSGKTESVIQCAKGFMDKTFPLREGSHCDAVSYMVYFQNLLVILADGTTTGLKKPRQFVGKNGPTNEPESILLRHAGMHAEIIFDRNGKTGAHDLANIDDIQLEAANHLLFNFEAASVSDKCKNYKNWFQLVNSDLSGKTFTAKDGEVFVANQDNWSIKLSDNANLCQLVFDQTGAPVSEATVDALIAALIYSNGRQGIAHLNMFIPKGASWVSDSLLSELKTLLARSRDGVCPVHGAEEPVAPIKVLTGTAVNVAPDVAAQKFAQSPTPHTAVMGALEGHGFELNNNQL